MKALALLSGGLDSILAIKLILNQNIEVEAITFLTEFLVDNTVEKHSRYSAEKLCIKLNFFQVDEDYLNLIKKPKYGYGSNMNPCIDCRIFMLKKAKEYMYKINAKFIITGEVLGERPMSQTKYALKLIEKEAGLEGFILRPLSAKLLEPTIPEKEGWIKREELLDIRGRCRKFQLKLAEEFGINYYSSPSGGCLLTDPNFSKRIKDLMRYNPDFDSDEIRLLKIGRHFRISDRAKLVVGRNMEENEKLINLARDRDLKFEAIDTKGPVGLGRGIFDKEEFIYLASSIIARYSDNNKNATKVAYRTKDRIEYVTAKPIDEEQLAKLRI